MGWDFGVGFLGGVSLLRPVCALGTCLAAARSRRGSDSPPGCHSTQRRRFATPRGKAYGERAHCPSEVAPPAAYRRGRGILGWAYREILRYAQDDRERCLRPASFCTAPCHWTMFSERAVWGCRVWFGVPGTWGSAPCRFLGTFGRAKSTAPQATPAGVFRSAPAFGGSGAEMSYAKE